MSADPLPANEILRLKAECDKHGMDIVYFAWRIQELCSPRPALPKVCCQQFETCRELCVPRADHWQGQCSQLRREYASCATRKLAPWRDFLEQQIHAGDRLTHPDGTEFVAIRLAGWDREDDAWRAVYDDASVSRLVLQIGDKGRAVLARQAIAAALAGHPALPELEMRTGMYSLNEANDANRSAPGEWLCLRFNAWEGRQAAWRAINEQNIELAGLPEQPEQPQETAVHSSISVSPHAATQQTAGAQATAGALRDAARYRLLCMYCLRGGWPERRFPKCPGVLSFSAMHDEPLDRQYMANLDRMLDDMLGHTTRAELVARYYHGGNLREDYDDWRRAQAAEVLAQDNQPAPQEEQGASTPPLGGGA